MAEQKAQHGCLRRLDEFMFCMSVTNQLGTYYHEGMYNDCRQHFQRWQTCLRSRLKSRRRARSCCSRSSSKITRARTSSCLNRSTRRKQRSGMASSRLRRRSSKRRCFHSLRKK